MNRILITGAGGTVGMLLATDFIRKNIPIVAVDRSEKGVADLLRMRLAISKPENLDVRYGDLMDKDFTRDCVKGCDTVIHCAALKHVSVGVYFPERLAVENITVFSNIISAVRAGSDVTKVLLCSSDKAAIPTSVMGASKYLLERMCQNVPGTKAVFSAVRFGNILGSSGSLSEVVARCVENKVPFPLTDPLMTRYILRKGELLNLINTALATAQNGEVWTLDLASAKVTDLIQVFSEELSKEPPEIKITGNTYSENVNEALFNDEEAKRVRKDGDFLIFGSKVESNLTPEQRSRVTSSENSALDINALRAHLASSAAL